MARHRLRFALATRPPRGVWESGEVEMETRTKWELPTRMSAFAEVS